MWKYILFLIAPVIFISCRKHEDIPPSLRPAPLLLKDVVEDHLPSPYYHFEYDSGKVSFVSFASDLTRYNVLYSAGRISEMRNNILVNKDRLQYTYNSAGKVEFIKYEDSTGFVYKTIDLFYDGSRLVKMNRARNTGSGFVFEKEITMSYYADGNLENITYHFLPFNGQSETISTSHFEKYDNKINVDGFSLVHDEFFDHLILLPGVQLQKNNPGKETRTGDGLNYSVDYHYTFNEYNEPMIKTGDLLISNGTQAGQRFQTSSSFTYYP